MNTCVIDGCEKSIKARGWCSAHYQQWRVTGSPTGSRQRPSSVVRWSRRVRTSYLGCWEWIGKCDPKGYGRYEADGSNLAHQWTYRHFIGPVPEGHELDHLCRRPACVNPLHLEPVLHVVNVRRGALHGRALDMRLTHCANGHEWTPETTTVAMRRGRPAERRCLICQREHGRRSRRRALFRVRSESVNETTEEGG